MKLDVMIEETASLKDALKRLDLSGKRVLLIVDSELVLVGTLSDGDARRALLSGKSLEDSVKGCYNSRPFSIKQSEYSASQVRKIFVEERIELIPVVDDSNRVLRIVLWDELLSEGVEASRSQNLEKMDCPVVIMAGGKGTRMAPFTNVLPKPLIPIGDKTILEHIMDRFVQSGSSRFHFTVNFRSEIIKAYFSSIQPSYDIVYHDEGEFRGTAGSLELVKDLINETFVVSNCDILVDVNWADVMKFHRNNSSHLTVISSIQHHKIPYGVVDFKAGGVITSIREKPEISFTINAGVYLLEPTCLDLLPERGMFHMTDMIEALLEKGKTVLAYPINENEYTDIGQWTEYNNAVKKMGA